MIQAVVKMVPAPERQDDALSILRSVAQRTRAEAGCMGCSLYRDTENDSTLVYEEVWRSKEELEHHLGKEEYKKVLLVMEMASFPPEIRFNTIKSTAGVEIIENVRTDIAQADKPEELSECSPSRSNGEILKKRFSTTK